MSSVGRKRKAQSQKEVEASNQQKLLRAFQTSASSISALFAEAVQQRQEAQDEGKHIALEKLYNFVESKYGSSGYIEVPVLLEYLAQEMQNRSPAAQATPPPPNFGGFYSAPQLPQQ